jgi:hypothetical protein
MAGHGQVTVRPAAFQFVQQRRQEQQVAEPARPPQQERLAVRHGDGSAELHHRADVRHALAVSVASGVEQADERLRTLRTRRMTFLVSTIWLRRNRKAGRCQQGQDNADNELDAVAGTGSRRRVGEMIWTDGRTIWV